RLHHEQRARGDVPGLEAELEEAVKAPRGDVSEIERRAPHAAHALCMANQPIEQPERNLWPLADVIGKPRAQQSPVHGFHRAGAQRDAVDRCPRAFWGGEELASNRIEDSGGEQPVRALRSKRDAEMRNTVRVVSRAVERIDEPTQLPPARQAALLGEDG